MPDDVRDKKFDQALARHLPNAAPDSECPDAEVLAAYHERTLSAEEMSGWKEHIAVCNRCQETLALVEQTEHVSASGGEREKNLRPERLGAPSLFRAATAVHPSPASVIVAEIRDEVGNLRRRPPWRSLISVGAIAATVIVWIGAREVRIQHRQQAYEAQIAQNRLSIPQLPIPQAEPRANLKKEESPAKKLDSLNPSEKKAVPPSPPLASPKLVSPSAETVAPPSVANRSAVVQNKKAMMGGTAGGMAPKQSSRSLASSYVAKSATANGTPSHPAAPPDANVNRQVDAKEQVDTAVQGTAQRVQTQAPSASAATSSTLEVNALDATAALVDLAAGNRRYIVAPGETHAWLLGAAGQIQHTTNGGKAWNLQNSGVIADLTAGSATSDKVCWVVGRAGTVLRTTDGGKHWKLLTPPIAEDLGGVHATDATHASIWNVTNRISYQTSDGGITWQPAANE
jgi:Photosynthesis system II assembly factor YCF48